MSAPAESRPIVVDTIRGIVVKAELMASAGLLVTLLVALTTQIVSRYVLTTPLVWTEEISRYLFVWLVLVGSAYVSAGNNHLALTVLTDRLGTRTFDIWMRCVALIVGVTSAVIAYQGIDFVESTIPLASPGSGISVAVVYFASIVGFGLITVHSLDLIVFGPRNRDDAEEMEGAV